MKTYILSILVLLYWQAIAAQNKFTDPTFNIGKGFSEKVKVIVPQKDGKILVGGEFSSFNGVERNGIARLNKDGSLDLSFKVQFTFETNTQAIAVQKDGKILIGGFFMHPNKVYKPGEFNPCCIVRLNTDGSTDATFNTFRGYNSPSVYSICIQPDGKILVGGDFDRFNGVKGNHLIRLNANGSIDTTFKISDKNAKIVFDIKLQRDGKILTAGRRKAYDYDRRKSIQRFNTDGTLDSAFNVGRRFGDDVWCIALLDNDQILASGGYNPRDTNAVCLITKLNIDGSTDNNFIVPRGYSNTVFRIAVQNDGKIIIAGNFGRIDTAKYMGIARLNLNGSIDSTFNKNNDFSIWVKAVALLPDDTIIVGGDEGKFPFGGEGRKYISRILYRNKK